MAELAVRGRAELAVRGRGLLKFFLRCGICFGIGGTHGFVLMYEVSCGFVSFTFCSHSLNFFSFS